MALTAPPTIEDSKKLADEFAVGNKGTLAALGVGAVLASYLAIALHERVHFLLLTLFVVMFVSALLFGRFLKRGQTMSLPALRWGTLGYLLLQVQYVTALVYISGGVAWFAPVLYFFFLIHAYIALSPWRLGGIILFVTPLVSFTILVIVQLFGILPFLSIIPGIDASLVRDPLYVFYSASLFLVSYAFIGFYNSHWALFLRERARVLRDAVAEISLERKRVANVVENLIEGLLFVDESGEIAYVNSRAQELLAVDKRELLGKSYSALLHKPNLQPLSELLQDPKKIEKKEFHTLDMYSRELTVDAAVIPLREGTKNLGYIIALYDVTREREIDHLRSEFVKMASHRIRTPLTSMKWIFSELFEAEGDHLSPEQKEMTKIGLDAINRLNVLITELLDAVSIEEGKFGYRFEKSAPAPVLSEQIDLFRKRFHDKNIDFWSAIEPDLPEVSLDREKIGVVVNNILDNAFWYTYPTGRVELHARNTDLGIVVSIFDTGIGISKKEKPRIFQKFFRGKMAQRLNTDGTGLSLYISKNIIDGHHGRIWFESKEGEGTTIFFTLPLSKEKG